MRRFLPLFLIVLAACGEDPQARYPMGGIPLVELDSPTEFMGPDEIHSIVHHFDYDEQTDRLLLIDRQADRPIMVVESSGEIVARLGGIGEGPNEFVYPYKVGCLDGLCTVWDLKLRRASVIDMSSDPAILDQVRIEAPGDSVQGLVVADQVYFERGAGTFLAFGATTRGIAWRYTPGRGWSSVGDEVPVAILAYPSDPDLWKRVSLNSGVIEPGGGDKLVLAFLVTGEVVIADREGTILSATPSGFVPQQRFNKKAFKVPFGGKTVKRTEYTPVIEDWNLPGFEHAHTAAGRIWAKHYGNTRDRRLGDHMLSDIHRINWSGRTERIYRADRELGNFVVTNDGRLIAVEKEQVLPRLLEWKLPG
ncbi:MAG: hypothetical protein R6X22_13620 [Gemmatimonadota bacterium]